MEIVNELLPFVKIAIIVGIAIPSVGLILFMIAWFKTFKTINKKGR